jgi:serine/threonine-protein kinase
VLADRYALGEMLGHGGSSIVYLALDQRTGQRVALKVLDPEPEHRATERERLFREARITASLDHEGVVRVLDSGPLPDGRAFLAMEPLRGDTLSARMRECFWLPLEEAIGIARQLLSALHAAHALGVVHRDVKPDNVFLLDGPSLETHPRIKLIDFGIGRDLGDPSSRVTAPDVVVGTVGYMAPEQLFGDDPTPRSDVYAAGATLYEMLSGRPPHRVASNDVREILVAMTRSPASLTTLRPALPERLAEGVMRALARRPDDRHADCRAMADACGLSGALAA